MMVPKLWTVLWGACALLISRVTAADYHGVVKRSDDANPLEAVVGQLSQTLTQVQAHVSAMESQLQARLLALESVHSKQVAFLAYSSADHVPANAPIPFSPALNLGNGYVPAQNVFVAPFPGVYIFTFQVFEHTTGDLLVDLMRNTDLIVRTRVFDQTLETSEASSVVVQAAAGDRFWLRPDRDISLYTSVHTFLSGALLTPL